MLALCYMLSSPYYAENYAGIIDTSLTALPPKSAPGISQPATNIWLTSIRTHRTINARSTLYLIKRDSITIFGL